MSDVFLRPIRLDGSEIVLVEHSLSDTFLLNSDRTLTAFRILDDARILS